MNKDFLFNTIIDSYINNFQDEDLIIDKRTFNDYISLNETFKIIYNFLKEYDQNLLNIFLNLRDINKDTFNFTSSDKNDISDSFNPANKKITIAYENNIKDPFAIIHELTHFVDYTNSNVKNNLIYSETSSVTLEFYLFKYLIKNNIHSLDSYNYIYNLLFRSYYDVFYYKYYEFKNNLKQLKFLEKIFPKKYDELMIKEINKLDDKLKFVFLNHYKEFDLRIKKDGILSKYYLKKNFSYIVAIFLAPYLLINNDQQLINKINKASYNDNIKISKFNPQIVGNYFTKYIQSFSNIKNKYPKYLPKYNINNCDELIFKIINNIPYEFQPIKNYLNTYIDIPQTLEIVRNFLKYYDKNLYNLFNNVMSFDKHCIKFEEVHDNEDTRSYMLMDTGEIVFKIENNIRDVFSIIHEFTHKIDYTLCNLSTTKLINYSEISTLAMEHRLFEYLIKNNLYSQDACNYIIEIYANSFNNAYYHYFVKLIQKNYQKNLNELSYINVDKADFKLKIDYLPERIKSILIDMFDKYIEKMKQDSLDHKLKSDIIQNIPYYYAFLLAPYLSKKDDHQLITKINRASYNLEEDITNIDSYQVEKEFNIFLNKIINYQLNIEKEDVLLK